MILVSIGAKKKKQILEEKVMSKFTTCTESCEFCDAENATCMAIDFAPFSCEYGKDCPLEKAIWDGLNESQCSPLTYLDEPSTNFEGSVPDFETLAVVSNVRKCCSEIHRLCHQIGYTYSTPQKCCRYVSCKLQFPPRLDLSNEIVRNHLSRLFSLSSTVIMESNDVGTLYTFLVNGIWKE